MPLMYVHIALSFCVLCKSETFWQTVTIDVHFLQPQQSLWSRWKTFGHWFLSAYGPGTHSTLQVLRQPLCYCMGQFAFIHTPKKV